MNWVSPRVRRLDDSCLPNKPTPTTEGKEGHWTDEEHALFLECYEKYNKSWKRISEIITTRSNEQIRTHAQKYEAKLRELRYGGVLWMVLGVGFVLLLYCCIWVEGCLGGGVTH